MVTVKEDEIIVFVILSLMSGSILLAVEEPYVRVCFGLCQLNPRFTLVLKYVEADSKNFFRMGVSREDFTKLELSTKPHIYMIR